MSILDICLATRNRPEELRSALKSLKNQTAFDDMKFYIIDGNDNNDNTDVINDELGWRKFEYFQDSILPRENSRKWTCLYNFLVAQGSGDFVTYWSDDIEIIGNSLFEKAINSVPTDAMAFHFINDPDETPHLMTLDEYSKDKGLPIINFGIIRREAWESLGGLDEQFDFYFADIDLSWRLNRQSEIEPLMPINGYVYNNRHDEIWRNPMYMQLRPDSAKFYQKWGLTPGVPMV